MWDLICDTPADPCLSGNVNSNCVYIGGGGYNPDVHNIMSYAPPTCLNHITVGQKERIHWSILNNSIFLTRVLIPSISGSDLLCLQSTYSVLNLPTGAIVQWSVNNASIASINSNTGVLTRNTNGNGNEVISTIISLQNNSYLPALSKSVWVGAPSFPGSVNGPTQLSPGSYATYSITPAQGATSYNWSTPSGCYKTYCWRINSGQGTTTISVQAGAVGNWAIQCTAYGCGTDSRYIPVTVLNPGDPCPPATLTLSPNPSTDGNVEIDVIQPPCDPTLTMSMSTTATPTTTTMATVIVTNSMGTTLYSGKHTGNKIQLKGMKLKPDTYHVVYISNDTKLDETMIVE